jgi:hypothetical protein
VVQYGPTNAARYFYFLHCPKWPKNKKHYLKW